MDLSNKYLYRNVRHPWAMATDMDMDMDYLFITPTYDHKIYDHDHGSVQNYTTLLGDDVEDCTWTDIGHRGTYLSIYLSIICLPTYPPPPLRST